MPETTTGDVTANTGSSVTAGTSGAGSTGDKSASDVIRELRERAQKAETALAEVAKKEEAARQEQLKAAGKFDEVETALKAKLTAAEERAAALEVKATEYEKQQTAQREATIASLPESQREYAASLPADKLPGFVAAITGNKPAPPKPGEPGVVPTGKLSPAEIAEGIRTGGTPWLTANMGRIVPG